jgi:GINS complex subunit 1
MQQSALGYCQRAIALLRDLKSSKWLPKYDEAGIRTVHGEIRGQHIEFLARFQYMEELITESETKGVEVDQDKLEQRTAGVHLYLNSMLRNKRIVLAYLFNRLEKIQALIWQVGTVDFPTEKRDQLSEPEVEYAKKYEKALVAYSRALGHNLDLTVDMLPPRSVTVQVRSLEDLGSILTVDSGTVDLSKGRVACMRRTDADPLLRAGKVERVVL